MARMLAKAGRYQLISELGRGSMGVVYEGFDPAIGRKVAIKTMLIEGLSPGEFQEFKARFQREARAAGILAHPNIVTVYDFGEDEGVLYLAMEYLEGKSLHQIAEKQGMLPVDTIIPILEQVSSALDHAHSHKIVHRDVKPANIMILNTGLVKVTDFGIAKMMSLGTTQVGQIIGTPSYMSPEQVKGRPVDGRSDIFSLGVILYELLTGEKPFGGQNVTTVIYKIVNENPVPPRELDASIHVGLSSIIQKALAKNPDERFQTCRELADSLRNFRSLGGAANPSATVMTTIPPVHAVPIKPQPPTAPAEPGRPPAGPRRVTPASPLPSPRPELAPQPAPPVKLAPSERRLPAPWIILALLMVGAMVAGGYHYIQSHGNRAVGTPLAPQAASQQTTNPQPSGLRTPEPVAGTAPMPKSEVQEPATGPAEANPRKKPAEAPTPPKSSPPPKYGQLLITSTPGGARIMLDGRSERDWLTPYTIDSLLPGAHRIGVWKDGFEKAERSVSVEAGRTEPLDVELRPMAGGPSPVPPQASILGRAPAASQPAGDNAYLIIQTKPPGMEVVIDGKSYGPSPINQILSVGTHTLVLRNSGVEVYSGTVVLKPGQVQTRSFKVGE